MLLGCLGKSWERPGSVSGPSWERPGALWARLGKSWGRLGASWGVLGTPWGCPGGVLGRLERVLGRLGSVPGASWGPLGVAPRQLRTRAGLGSGSEGAARAKSSPGSSHSVVFERARARQSRPALGEVATWLLSCFREIRSPLLTPRPSPIYPLERSGSGRPAGRGQPLNH